MSHDDLLDFAVKIKELPACLDVALLNGRHRPMRRDPLGEGKSMADLKPLLAAATADVRLLRERIFEIGLLPPLAAVSGLSFFATVLKVRPLYVLALYSILIGLIILVIKLSRDFTEKDYVGASRMIATALVGVVVEVVIAVFFSAGLGPPILAANDPNPCIQLTKFGMKCSPEEFATAIAAGNKDAIRLEVEGGVKLDTDGLRDETLQNLNAAPNDVQDYTLALLKAHGLNNHVDSPCNERVYDDLADTAQNLPTTTFIGCQLTFRRTLYCALKRLGFSDEPFDTQVITSLKRNVSEAGAVWDRDSGRNCGAASPYPDAGQTACSIDVSNFKSDWPTRQAYVDHVTKVAQVPTC